METINEIIEFKGCRVHIIKKGLEDANFEEDIDICLINDAGTCNLEFKTALDD